MAIKLYLPGAGPSPAPTSGPDVFAALGISPAELIQNFINLRDAIEKIYGEAANQTEENALFAAGYRFITRTDEIAVYVPESKAPTGTITMTMLAALYPTSTITMVIQ